MQSRDDGLLPAPGQPWTDADSERLLQIAEAEFRDAESRGVTGKPLLWELEKQNIREDLVIFLVAEARVREQSRPAKSAWRLLRFWRGLSRCAGRGDGLRFRGLIDRVDISVDGKSALVMDYKTGSPSPYTGLEKDPIDHGKRLQLGIYSLAAQRMAPEATEVKAAYWLTSREGDSDLRRGAGLT